MEIHEVAKAKLIVTTQVISIKDQEKESKKSI